MRALLLIGALVLALFGGDGLARADAPDAEHPNVVFILVDDLGFMDIGANNPGSFYDTPNIDRLAATGARFTNAYAACPVCSPTRASVMTGKYPARVGITDYINPAGRNQPAQWRRNTPLLPAPFDLQLALEEVTIAETLREHGYATFFAGKWHLGSEGFFPEDQGFDVNRGGIERGGPYGGKKYFSPYGNARLADGPEGEHLPARLAAETASFMRAHRDEPFFAMLSFYSVHTPLMGRADLVEKYRARRAELPDANGGRRPERARTTRLVQSHAVYAAMVEAMDEAVGVVLDTLDELGLADDTIVVFFSDNGGLSTSEGHPTSNEPFRAGKGWLYEGGIREPCLVRAPGVTTPGTVCEHPIISTDFLPTIVELTRTGDRSAGERDGRSIVPLLRAPETRLDRAAIFWHYPHYGNQGAAPSGAVRAGPWKLIEWYEDDAVELYNLDLDPSESLDFAPRFPERVQTLRAMLRVWRDDVGARDATPNPAYTPWTLRPVPSKEDRAAAAGWHEGDWLAQHEDINRIARDRDVDLVFLGDSITQSWGGPGRRVGSAAGPVWDEHFGHLVAINGGISGDRTQHLLWRIDHGALDGIDPKYVVVMIGTNNLGHDPPEEIAAGITAVVDRIHAKTPNTTVLVCSIVRGADRDDPLRRDADRVNALIRDLDTRTRVTYVDLARRFYADGATVRPDLMHGDFVHFRPDGYRVWAEALPLRTDDPWAAFDLIDVDTPQGTIRVDPGLEPHLASLTERAVAELRAYRDDTSAAVELALRRDEVIGQINGLVGYAPKGEAVEQQITLFRRSLAMARVPLVEASTFELIIVRGDRVEQYLRDGGTLPSFRYDAATDEVDVEFALMSTASWNPERYGELREMTRLDWFPVRVDEPYSADDGPLLVNLVDADVVTWPLHELAEAAIGARIRPPGSAWFFNGFGRVIAEMVVSELGDAEALDVLHRSVTTGDIRIPREDLQLRYWPSAWLELRAPNRPYPIAYERELAMARGAWAYQEARKLVDDHGPGVLRAIVDRAAQTPPSTGNAFIGLISDVTGEPMAERLLAYERIHSRRRAMDAAAARMQEARKRGDLEAEFIALSRARELELYAHFNPAHTLRAAELLTAMGHFDDAVAIIRHQCRTVPAHARDTHTMLAVFAIEQQRPEAGYDSATWLLERGDTGRAPRLLHAHRLFRAGRVDEARTIADELEDEFDRAKLPRAWLIIDAIQGRP